MSTFAKPPLSPQQKPCCDSDCGASAITTLIFGLLIAAVCYSAYHIIPFYYYYFELENQMSAAARVASTQSDTEIRKKLLYQIKKMNIPVDPDTLTITRDREVITMSLPYEEVFYLSFNGKEYDIFTFKFHARISERY